MKAEKGISFCTLLVGLFAAGSGQLGPPEHCIDLLPQNNLTIHKISGTWFGAEVITHRDMISGEKSSKDCVFVVITEISHIIHNLPKSSELTKNIGSRNNTMTPARVPPNQAQDYHFLRLEWTEGDDKMEFILRYNVTRNGFWIASAPDRYAHYRDQLSYGTMTGLIQVIAASDSYLVLTFCETVPTEKLFSVILARRTKPLSLDTVRSLQDKLRVERHLPTIVQRQVCSGIDSMRSSFVLAVIVSIMHAMQFQ